MDNEPIEEYDDDGWNDERESCFDHTENAHHFIIEWQTGSMCPLSLFINHARGEQRNHLKDERTGSQAENDYFSSSNGTDFHPFQRVADDD